MECLCYDINSMYGPLVLSSNTSTTILIHLSTAGSSEWCKCSSFAMKYFSHYLRLSIWGLYRAYICGLLVVGKIKKHLLGLT